MTDVCPTNSTECLLRAIVDAQTGFDWNPLNFAFTAALSILAVIVALIAAIQAAFAAGPGRLKASSSVIGPKYHALARTTFKPIELRFRTQVKVPWIDMNTIARRAEKLRRSQDLGLATAAQGDVHARAPYVAGWACLLHQLGISDLDFQTDICDTDYLPGDIMAPPAFIAVGNLVLLALCAGCDRLSEDASLISAQGPSVYMEMHNHSNLGLTATYRTFDVSDTFSRLLKFYSLIELDRTLEFAQGCIRCQQKKILVPPRGQDGGLSFEVAFDTLAEALHLPGYAIHSWSGFFNHPKGNFKDTQLLIGLLLADHPPERIIFPFEDLPLRSFLTYFRYTVIEKPMANALRTRIKDSFAMLCPSSTCRDIIGNLTDQYTINLGSFYECSWLTSAAKYKPFIAPSLTPKAPLMSSSTHKHNRSPTTFCISDDALHHAFRWLSTLKHFESLDSSELHSVRDCLQFQLAELDCWLSMHAQDDCRRVSADLIHKSPYVRPYRPATWTKIKLEKVSELVIEEFEIPYTKTSDGEHVVIEQVLPREKILELADRTEMLDAVLKRRGLKREDLTRSKDEEVSGGVNPIKPSPTFDVPSKNNNVDATGADGDSAAKNIDEKKVKREAITSFLNEHDPSGIDLSDLDEQRREAVELLMFLRAVLVGALIESGVDSTHALKLKNKNAIVMLQ